MTSLTLIAGKCEMEWIQSYLSIPLVNQLWIFLIVDRLSCGPRIATACCDQYKYNESQHRSYQHNEKKVQEPSLLTP